MEQQSLLIRFLYFWIDVEKYSGLSAGAAVVLNLLLMIVKIAVVPVAGVFAAAHYFAAKLRWKEDANLFHKLLAFLLTLISLALDLLLAVLLWVMAEGFIGGVKDLFTTDSKGAVLVFLVLMGALIVLTGKLLLTLLVTLFGKAEKPER